jgi:hypothetical protein
MAPKRKFDSQLALLDSLRSVSPESAGPELAKALQLSNSFLVAKAAAIIRHHGLTSLSPTVAGVLARFLTDPEQSDQQCLAKIDLAKTLAAFEYQDAELFLTGMRHFQLRRGWEQEIDCAVPCAVYARWPWFSAANSTAIVSSLISLPCSLTRNFR